MVKLHDNDIEEGSNDEIKSNVLIPRRVIFLIDKSGSMSGIKWDKTILSTINALKLLRINYDRFGIIFFNNNNNGLLITANNKNILNLIQCIKNQKPQNCTSVNDWLLESIKIIKNDIESLNNDKNIEYNYYMNQIIFITDGEPNKGEIDTKQIILNVKNENILNNIDKYSKKISIYSFGIGKSLNDSSWINDLNHNFLKLLSINNNRVYKRIKDINCYKQ